MLRILMGMIGLGAIAAVPAQATTELPDIAPHAHSIEALEDLAWRYPALKAAIRIELARFECAMGQQWRCGAEGKTEPGRKGYGA